MAAPIKNLKGKTYGFLEVVELAERKSRGNQLRTRWKCHCTRCGNYTDVYADTLESGYVHSCGCIAADRDIPQKIRDEFIGGTQISKIQSKPTASNKSGVVGVNWDKSRNKWQASIKFQRHKYNLGRFDNFEDAVKVRKDAEIKYFGGLKYGNKENECNDK